MKISITRALAELKTLDARINAAISQGVYVAVVRGKDEIPLSHAKKAEQLKADIESSYQKVESLIKRREAIKRAIIVSNGHTKVSIGGESMTVAEAIEKKSSINYLQTFFNKLNNEFVQANHAVQVQETQVSATIEKRVMAAYGNDKGKVTPEQHQHVSDAVKAEFAPKLLDPKGIENKKNEVWKRYEDFSTEVDFALSESNARTEIEIPE